MTVCLCIAGLVVPSVGFPCSSFLLANRHAMVFGANYDHGQWPGQLFINKSGVRKEGWEAGTTGRIARWTSRYGSVTIAAAGYQLPWAAMNETGLVLSSMSLFGTRYPRPDERPPLTSAYWLQYVLDTCATVEEVLAAANDVRMTETLDHYLVCDATGDCAALEFLDRELVVSRGAALPVPALTNLPYSQCLGHSKAAGGRAGHTYHSFDRFDRLALRMEQFKESDRHDAVAYAFDLLENVKASNTRWSVVLDPKERIFYLRSFKNARLRFVDLTKIDFSCKTPVLMLDAHASGSGDMLQRFEPYSHGRVLAHLLQALKQARPDMTPDLVRALLMTLEYAPCESRRPAATARRH